MLSLCDLPAMFLLGGIEFSHQTVHEEEARLTRALINHLRSRRGGRIGRSWYLHETILPEHWSTFASARRVTWRPEDVLRSARAVSGVTSAQLTTDGHDSYPRAIRTVLGDGMKHRSSQYLNDRIEQDHRGIKSRYGPMWGSVAPPRRIVFELRRPPEFPSLRTGDLQKTSTRSRRRRFLRHGLLTLRVTASP